MAVQYGERLVREGVLTAEEVGRRCARPSRRACREAYDAVQQKRRALRIAGAERGAGDEIAGFCPRTAVNHAGAGARDPRHRRSFPENFHLHPKLRGFVEKRRDAVAKGAPIDWAFGEALAFGTLVLEGTPVRLSGQDSGRGTFSQRHLAFYDSETGKRYVPLQHIAPGPGPLRRAATAR